MELRRSLAEHLRVHDEQVGLDQGLDVYRGFADELQLVEVLGLHLRARQHF